MVPTSFVGPINRAGESQGFFVWQKLPSRARRHQLTFPGLSLYGIYECSAETPYFSYSLDQIL